MIRVNLMGLPKERKRARAPLITFEGSIPLIILVVVILGVAGYAYVQQSSLQARIMMLNENIMMLNQERDELNQIKVEYDANLARREALQARIRVLEALEARKGGPYALLSTLSTAVVNTDSLWLTGFTQTGQTITIEGTAFNVRAVADFLTRLLNARIFATVDLRETSQDPAQREMEQFSFILNGEMAPPPAPPAATTPTPAAPGQTPGRPG